MGGEAFFLLAALLLAFCSPVHAQTPRIAALFPAGAKAGETVEVAVKGGGLAGAQQVLVLGAPGVTAELVGGGASGIDETARPVFQNKCTSCHEPRSPANRSLSADQWAATVDRMINARGAEINKPDRDKIVGYLQGMAKSGQVSAKIMVAPNAAPGKRELRLVTSSGASSAWTFEVGNIPEVATTTTTPGTRLTSAPKVAFPVVVNGLMANAGQRDYFSFEAKQGQRITFDLKANRLNPQSQGFFSPVLVLYDADGREIAKNLGRFGIDPALSWTPTQNGTITLLVRDLLWHGSPASVYRLSVGTNPPTEGGILFPPFARPGDTFSGRLIEPGEAGDGSPFALTLPMNGDGLTTVSAQGMDARLLVRDVSPGGLPNGTTGTAAPLPSAFWGRLTSANQTDVFTVSTDKGGTGLEVYARRLGSLLLAQVVVKNSKGVVVAQRISDGNEDDFRLPNAFPAPGTYQVEISDANGNSGPDFVYTWETMQKSPQFTLTVSPDVISIAPGGTTAFLVRATRRDNLPGPIQLSLSGLPSGVSLLSTEAVIPPDADQAVFVLHAEPTAIVGSSPVSVAGTVAGETGDGKTSRQAESQELFRVNNVLHNTPRKSQMVSVTAEAPPFTLSLPTGGDTLSLMPGSEARLQVLVNRTTNKGEIALSVLGLPPGITTQNVVTVPANQNTATFVVRASRDAKGLGSTRPLPNLPPVRITVVGYPSTGGANNSDFAPLAATPPITLVSK